MRASASCEVTTTLDLCLHCYVTRFRKGGFHEIVGINGELFQQLNEATRVAVAVLIVSCSLLAALVHVFPRTFNNLWKVQSLTSFDEG